jgi:hypothetical protein
MSVHEIANSGLTLSKLSVAASLLGGTSLAETKFIMRHKSRERVAGRSFGYPAPGPLG